MTISNLVSWRCRPSGSNTNGGGYDPGVAGVLSTTLNGSIASGATSIVVTLATGWPSSGNYYARIGTVGGEIFSSGNTGSSEIVLVTAGQGTTTWTVTRAQLGTVAQAFATGIVVDNELSRGNTAIASGTAGVSTASTTFVDATASFNATYIGNALWLASGTGTPTVGPYFIQSITNATTVVLDRVSGTYTAGHWAVGGAWSSDAHGQFNSTWLLPGHTTFLRGTGTGSTASPDHNWSAGVALISGDPTIGLIRWMGENGAPTGLAQLPVVFWKASSGVFSGNSLYQYIYGVYNFPAAFSGINDSIVDRCILDQFGQNVTCFSLGQIIGSEVFSSTGTPSGSAPALGNAGVPSIQVIGCNVHDTFGPGIFAFSIAGIFNSIIRNCNGYGINLNAGADGSCMITGNTIDNNQGDGIVLDATNIGTIITSNFITNHTKVGTYGINANFGSTKANDLLRSFLDYNWYFGNTTNSNNVTVGTGVVNGEQLHDTIGVDPQYVSEANQNYAIGANALSQGFPRGAFLQSKSGQVGSVTYLSPGAVQTAS